MIHQAAMTQPWHSRAKAAFTRLRADEAAVALSEFALSLPLVMAMGGAGIEYSNMALMNLRINQIALNLADNASRVGLDQSNNTTQLREADLNDVLQGMRLQATGLNLTTYGRVTLSSLEMVQRTYSDANGTTINNDAAATERIHWQRCIGLKSGAGFDSSYGTTSTTAGTDQTYANRGADAATGMGDTGFKVNAPSTYGVMFVEVNYQYQPLFGTLYTSGMKLHATASMMVRDNRDFAQIYNPNPAATRSLCNAWTT